ncbi:MAG: FAD-dependent oxidoreductase [Candidatus Marinimicrobia bacterium]|nr:FAD-dependent oxidoreductase [Candidatus Neomarinimicrobiota bacterium]
MHDLTVIGGGVIGLAVARHFQVAAGWQCLVVEREASCGLGISARNSEVLHAGFYYPPGSLKARLCVEGRAQLVAYLQANDLPLNLCASPWVGLGSLIEDRYQVSYGPVLGFGSYWPLLLLSAVVTLASVLLARRRLRHRRSPANLVWWVVVVALLSWPGYLLCLITTRLPKHVRCPDCSRPRPPETAT